MFRLILLSLALSSCAATSGREWLASPIDERSEPSVASVVETHAVEAPRPRLSHTVTLGESYATSNRTVGVTAAGGASPLQVNVHTRGARDHQQRGWLRLRLRLPGGAGSPLGSQSRRYPDADQGRRRFPGTARLRATRVQVTRPKLI